MSATNERMPTQSPSANGALAEGQAGQSPMWPVWPIATGSPTRSKSSIRAITSRIFIAARVPALGLNLNDEASGYTVVFQRLEGWVTQETDKRLFTALWCAFVVQIGPGPHQISSTILSAAVLAASRLLVR